MVKIKYGANISNMSGKLGGQVYSHNASGPYLRNIGTIGVAPSDAILASQARFASVVTAWKALTDQQRQAWQASTVNFLKKNVFADTFKLNGFTLFMSLNINRLVAGAIMLTYPPFPTKPNQIYDLSIVPAGGNNPLTLNASVAAVPNDEAWLIEATPSISPTVNNYVVKLALIIPLQPTSALPRDIYPAYFAKYGAPVPGMRAGFRVTPIHLPSGTPGQRFYSNVLFV